MESLLFGPRAARQREEEVLMGDERIEELLAKVRKLDPETDEAYSWLGMQLPFEIDQKVLEYLLQGVIQDAIETKTIVRDYIYHRLFWGIKQNDKETAGKYHATISIRSFNSVVALCDGDTPAEALLAAYVAVLEAEANR
jgi:hypothetical protein